MKKLLYVLSITLLFSCHNSAQVNEKQQAVIDAEPNVVALQDGKARAYFASGCFWCVEAVYESVKGVEEVINGYSGGYTENPTYEASNTGRTGHAEAVEVIYDPKVVSFATLVDVYFGSQNPTQVNGQGPDRGSQYRSIIFYQDEAQKKIIDNKKATLALKLDATIAAAMSRLRPVMMASLTTILGMSPLISDAMFGSTAIVIMFGLAIGSVITLVVVPVFYAVLYGIDGSVLKKVNAIA